MQDTEITFIYQDSRGNITARSVSDISETDRYLQGLCNKANELRTFRKDRILEIIKNPIDAESRLGYYISINPPPKEPPKSHHLLDVCFTGFKSEDKNRLKKLAENVGLIIRSSVTRSLNFLCCGYNAGPKKIEKARKQNVIVINEEQFMQFVGNGEIPEY